MVCPDSEKGTDNIVRSLEGEFGGGTEGWAVSQHGSERVAASSSNVESA